jgi:hypothetical protein
MLFRFEQRAPFDFCSHYNSSIYRDCQMVYFQTKNPNLGKFWRVLQWKMYANVVAIRSILQPFGIFSLFGMLYQEKSEQGAY